MGTISQAYVNDDDYEKAAIDHIDKLYAYDIGPVLFKPTKAREMQFRGDKESALSYFVAINGGNAWTHVRFMNTGVTILGESAIAMGNYYFTPTNGTEAKVEYSFSYILDEDEHARINLHHSSLPFPKV